MGSAVVPLAMTSIFAAACGARASGGSGSDDPPSMLDSGAGKDGAGSGHDASGSGGEGGGGSGSDSGGGTIVRDAGSDATEDKADPPDATADRTAPDVGTPPPPPMDAGTPPPMGPCKRGIASDQAPSGALAPTQALPGVSWWYNWGDQGDTSNGVPYVPMIFTGGGWLNGPIPSDSKFLMGFNEPNFADQGNLTPQQAADDWPAVEALAKPLGIPLVSPGVNFCSPCTTASITDPYTWLKDFFAACTGCQVDYIAVHWYNCDLPSLEAYLYGSSTLEGFTQFGKPIWLTEFACGMNNPSVADQQAYMAVAIPWLEASPHVYRYSWFSAAPIPSSQLMNSDGSLTSLGQYYVSLPEACR